ncbi:MAG TPA: hypothetical protein VKB66_07430 [Candidatus Acidoferrum sp.]|nr:hypothetical protein [Candidatus Acidoferrum sp.]
MSLLERQRLGNDSNLFAIEGIEAFPEAALAAAVSTEPFFAASSGTAGVRFGNRRGFWFCANHELHRYPIRVRQRYGRHFLLDRRSDDLVRASNVLQERILAVTIQMDEHRCPEQLRAIYGREGEELQKSADCRFKKMNKGLPVQEKASSAGWLHFCLPLSNPLVF